MASKIIREVVHQPDGLIEILAICDTAADVTALGTEYAPGSVAKIPGGSVYIAKSDGTFVEEE